MPKLRAEDKLHFSPRCIFGDLDFNDKRKLICCVRDRIYGFYLTPAKLLDTKEYGFGCGLLCVATIDSLARISYPEKVGCRIKKWLKNNIPEFREEDFANRFYEDFRNGLVHEGRIKNPGEFSYEPSKIITREDRIIRINPRILLRRLEEVVERFLIELEKNPESFSRFKDTLIRDFGDEVRREKAILK